jgi:hypothetical protein
MDKDWLQQCVSHHFPTLKDRAAQLMNAPELLDFAHNVSTEEPLFLVCLVTKVLTNRINSWPGKVN